MNIFAVCDDTETCARYLDDKRLVKMVLETAQILCTSLHINGYSDDNLYRKTHAHHPVVQWCASNRFNYYWTVRYFNDLCLEYTRRYSKHHKCQLKFGRGRYFTYRAVHIPDSAYGNMTPFCNCTKDYKHIPDTFLAYKLQLQDKWYADKRPATCRLW